MFLIPESAHTAAKNGPLFVILNSASGHKDSYAEHQVLADVFNSAGWAFEFLQFDNTSNIASASAKAVALAKEKDGVVVAAGGDGTINAVASGLLGASISPVTVGEVNGRVSLVNASLGLYPQLLEDREAWKQQFGRSRLVAFASGLATLFQARGQLLLEIEMAGIVVRPIGTLALFDLLARGLMGG